MEIYSLSPSSEMMNRSVRFDTLTDAIVDQSKARVTSALAPGSLWTPQSRSRWPKRRCSVGVVRITTVG